MNDMERRYTTRDLAEMLGVEAVTVRKYALALEKAGYSIDRSDGKNRSYNERDVMAFKYLQSIRARTSITVDEAAALINQKNMTDTERVTIVDHSEGEAIHRQYDERYDLLMAKMEQILANQQAAPALSGPAELRSERLNERMTERRIERQLEREALDLWVAKPETERMKKVGLFKKEEDTSARDRFVRDYVDEHYDDRIRKAYGYDIG